MRLGLFTEARKIVHSSKRKINERVYWKLSGELLDDIFVIFLKQLSRRRNVS